MKPTNMGSNGGFQYFRRGKRGYAPRTFNAAIRAFAAGLLPAEACVALGTSTKPLNEEPYDLEAIEQILSREHLDLETNLLVMSILTKLLRDPDAEVALFAAESINAIESRYTRRIEALKEQLAAGEAADTLRALARQYYELAQMHPSAIRNFYLREAYGYIKRLNRMKRLGREEVGLLVRLLLALGLTDQARKIVDQFPQPTDPSLMSLEAEVAFRARDLTRLHELCTRLKTRLPRLEEGTRAFLSYWLEESGG